MRRRLLPTAVLLVLGSPKPQPVSAKDAARTDVAVAANAGSYSAFRLLPSAESPVPPTFAMLIRQKLNVDVADPRVLANLTVDRDRSIVMSSGIVDPGHLQALLASPEVPPETVPLLIRDLLVVPVTDPTRALAALDQLVPDRDCVRPRGQAKRWATWLDQLEDPGDRRTAQTSDAAYLCVFELSKAVVRVDRARREIHWVSAGGIGSLLTAASEKVELDGALADRLRREGFFSARAAMFTTPAGDAHLQAALGLLKTRMGLMGVTADLRPRLWRKGAHEMGAPQRLIESPPVLLEGMVGADGVFTWMLTGEGRKFFASLRVQHGTSVKSLKARIAATLKPGGVFRDARELADTQHEAGSMSPTLIRHALWPHAIAFAAAHPDAKMSFLSFFDDENASVDVDVAAGRVRLRLSGPR
jgi:hypothetical protein